MNDTPAITGTYQTNKDNDTLNGALVPGAAPRLGLISNPLSGGNRKSMSIIRRLLTGHSQICHREARTPAEITSALDEFSCSNVNIVGINGGDGTVHAVLTELFRCRSHGSVPLLVLLRAGTASMLARDVGLHGSQRAGFERLLHWSATGSGTITVLERPILKVERASDDKALFGMFFGAAGICQGIRFCLDRVHTKGVSGELAAGLTLIRFFLSALRGDRRVVRPVQAHIALDDEPSKERELLFVLMTTLERLFLGIRPYWGTETAPIYYTALGARPRRLLRLLPLLLRGGKSPFGTPENGYFSHKIHKALITVAGGFTLDGELYDSPDDAEPVCITQGGTASFLRL